jgi:hypothetical protein
VTRSCTTSGAPVQRESLDIEYRYAFGPDDTVTHKLRLDSHSLERLNLDDTDAPEWARLEFHKCVNCPLSPEEHAHCPAALAIAEVATTHGQRSSCSEVHVEVTTAQRTIAKTTLASEALFPLLGLSMATSGCPVLAYLKPMARFHLPFSDSIETTYRALSMYLVAQVVKQAQGQSSDFTLDGLRAIYEQIHHVNLNFADRLRAASSADANINGLTNLDMFAQNVPFNLERAITTLATLFDAYLPAPSDTDG